MKVNLLYTEGDGSFKEQTWEKPPVKSNEIEVRAVMTGVCRSDIDMMNGEFGPLPLNMQGHEGLGQVTAVGSRIKGIRVGDFVATRGEPAFADYYNVRESEFVLVPEAHPRYILEPVACGVNLIAQDLSAVVNRSGSRRRLLIVGSGFLAWCAYNTIKNLSLTFESIEVLGSNNEDLWERHNVLTNVPQHKEYNVIIDVKDNNTVLTNHLLAPQGLWVIACEKPNISRLYFGELLWKAASIIFPSPRNKDFQECMTMARDWIKNDTLNVDKFWSKGYNRKTEWQQAFEDGNNRPQGYSRGYIKWD